MPGQQKVDTSAESVVVVDDHNVILGAVPRIEMRAQALCHRATYIFVFNSLGQLYVQQRTQSKDIYPGYYDPATGGVVTAGESYDQAARRELAEELGISNVVITPHFHFFFHSSNCQVWGRVYSCYHDGPVSLQTEEVAAVVLESPQQVLANQHQRNYTPDSLMALERLVHLLGC